MSTTIPSRTTGPQRGSVPQVAGGARVGAPARAHLRLVPAAGGARSAAEARARASHPAGRAHRPLAAQPAPLRLTGRGRVVLRTLVVVLMLVVMGVAGLTLARAASAADGPVPAVVVHTHVVLPGETLWGIAHQVAPHDDPRDTVARIAEFNSLTSTAVHAGQHLALPPGLSER
jgi:nucleoid-associated protein YgaU